MPAKKATKAKPAPAKPAPADMEEIEEKPTENDQMETDESEKKIVDNEEHEATEGENEIEQEKVTNEEYSISNTKRAKAADKAGRIEKDGMPEIWAWGRPYVANREGSGMVQIEHVRPIDFYNPFLYAAIQNASQVNYESYLKQPSADGYFDSNNLSDGKLTLHYRSDFTARNMQNNFFRFIRTPGHKIVIKRSIKCRLNQAPERNKIDLPGVMIDIPLPMRSIVIRAIPDDADLAKVIAALNNVTEDMIEKHEIRKDARGNNCALLTFKTAYDCIKTHMNCMNVKFADDQEQPTKVYYQAAAVFYETLLHVWELDEKTVKSKYSVAMQTTDHKFEVFDQKKEVRPKSEEVKRREPLMEEGVTPTQAKKARKSAPKQQQQQQQQRRQSGRQYQRQNTPRQPQRFQGRSFSMRKDDRPALLQQGKSQSPRGRISRNYQDYNRDFSVPSKFRRYSENYESMLDNNMDRGNSYNNMNLAAKLAEQQKSIQSLQQQVTMQQAMSNAMAMRNLQSSLGASRGFDTTNNLSSPWGGASTINTRPQMQFGSRY